MIDDKSHAIANKISHGDFAAPFGARGTISCGRLIFASGATDIELVANADATQLYSAHFAEPRPNVRVQDGIVTLKYRRLLSFKADISHRQPLAQIALNTIIPWEIEFRDGISRLTGDLRQVQLCALDMSSVSTAILALPTPNGLANIYISGSASNLTLHRPTGVALRLHIAGASSHLQLDDECFDAIHRDMRWQSRNYQDTPQRYDLSIAGSVSNLTVDTR